MLSNGNYAQYLPQGLPPQFIMGAFGAGTPQFGQQGLFGTPGLYGGHPGYGLDFGYHSYPGYHSGYQGLGQQFQLGTAFGGSGQQIVGQQIVLALGQLAQHVATQGVLAHQIGAWLGQLTQQLAQQIALQDRLDRQVPFGQVPFANTYGGFAGNSPFIGVGNQAGFQAGFGNPGFGATLGQNPFGAATSGGYGGQGFAPQGFTPQAQMWGTNRPAMAS
jgi:hypothetical protein